jgi:adenosylcobalamin-dependent ribonucleoside-triphosphate reductase
MTTYFTTGTPSWGPVGKDIYERTYSRIKANGDRETWFDTVVRVVEGNTKFVDPKFIEKNEKEDLFELIYNFRAIPAGRHLWVTGVPGRQFISNCWNSHWYDKFSTHFTFLFERLMEGGGVGANYSTKYLRQYNQIKHDITVHFVCTPEHKDYDKLTDYLSEQYSPDWSGAIAIPDSREGWVESLRKVIDSAFEGSPPLNGTVPANTIVFDVSQIRPQGAKIKSFGGTASGPFALMEMLAQINSLLNGSVGSKPSSMLCMDLDHEIGRCVVAGNVRRSARMSMKSWKDDDIMEFLTCKADGMRHWTTNISVVVDNLFFRKLKEKDKQAKKIAQIWAKGQLKNGEPGFYNISKASEGEPSEAFTTNPCGEITFSLPSENCNLGHVNASAFVDNKSGFLKACRLMARFLLRATFADFPDPGAKAAIETNRRIGVGLFGLQGWLNLQGIRFSEAHENESVRKVLRKAKEVIRKEARDYAFQLRIPEPIKVTTVAPTGTIAKMPGTSEGIHPIFGRYFIRRIMFSLLDPLQKQKIEEYEALGYPVEDSVYTPNTKVVSFYVKDPLVDQVMTAGHDESVVEQAGEIDLDDMLAVQAMVQQEFADNAISFTINIQSDRHKVGDLVRAMRTWGPRLKGTTVMPMISDRPQMPYQQITKEEYEAAEHKQLGQGEIDCPNNVCPIK